MNAPVGRLIGVVHLAPLPGAPGFMGDMGTVMAAAVADARRYVGAGFDALIVENFGDAPFFPDDVPPETVAAMTRIVGAVVDAVAVPVGVNVLRNDGLAALAIAVATSAAFIRVNVLSGSMYTDQGLIHGRAAEVARKRAAIAPHVRVYADVMVKHATPPPGTTLEGAVADLAERGGPDGIVISGSGTGRPAGLDDVKVAKSIAPHLPVLIGSGTDAKTVAKSLAVADAVIVGTAAKEQQVTTNPVSPRRAAAIAEAAGRSPRRT